MTSNGTTIIYDRATLLSTLCWNIVAAPERSRLSTHRQTAAVNSSELCAEAKIVSLFGQFSDLYIMYTSHLCVCVVRACNMLHILDEEIQIHTMRVHCLSSHTDGSSLHKGRLCVANCVAYPLLSLSPSLAPSPFRFPNSGPIFVFIKQHKRHSTNNIIAAIT